MKKAYRFVYLFFVLMFFLCSCNFGTTEDDMQNIDDVVNYSVTYHLDGGTNNINNPTSYNSTKGNVVLKNATKEGYDFVGWFDNDSFSGSAITNLSNLSHDIVLYAKWKKFLIISFDSNSLKVLVNADKYKQVKIYNGETLGNNLPSPVYKSGYSENGGFYYVNQGKKYIKSNSTFDLEQIQVNEICIFLDYEVAVGPY